MALRDLRPLTGRKRAVRYTAHAVALVGLTALTQLGGAAWLLSRFTRRKVLAFILAYAGLSLAALWLAPLLGRVPLSCSGDGPLKVQSWLYCVTNRNYVTPELNAVLMDLATSMNARFPGTQTLVLDANFPFWDGFPLLPHLSHADGRKVDIAFYYRDRQAYRRGETRSPIGYFAFEPGPTPCPPVWLTLRWDFAYLQPLWRDLALDRERTRYAIQTLVESNTVGKVFIEPHLRQSLEVTDAKVRFQGCRAARHDDHIHLQL